MLVQRAVDELFNQGKLEAAEEIYGPAYAAHERHFAQLIRAAFPDLQLRIESMIAEDDRIATRWICEGTRRGTFLGVAPTGRRARWTGTWTQRIDGGRIAEGMDWGNWDMAGLMAQLTGPGMLPREYVLPGDAVFPEGVVVSKTGEWFASSFTRGTIFRGRVEKPQAEVFLEGGGARRADERARSRARRAWAPARLRRHDHARSVASTRGDADPLPVRDGRLCRLA